MYHTSTKLKLLNKLHAKHKNQMNIMQSIRKEHTKHKEKANILVELPTKQ